jgi:hypothetical protein
MLMRKFSKSWRKSNLEKKTKILQESYDLDIFEIERIRKITDPKKKLVQAATLQFESFGNIHSDITSWIAGYRSDSVVRDYFTSTLALRKLVMPPQENFSDIGVSWRDIRNRFKVPRNINEDLSEEIGIHIGDGNLSVTTHRGWDSYVYRVDGCLRDEFIYHDDFIRKLMKRLYNCSPYLRQVAYRNSIQSCYSSKLIVKYKHQVLGLPFGCKKKIEIPKVVFDDDSFAIRCLVGIMDTDFTYSSNQSIQGALTSLRVIKQMGSILERLNVSFSSRISDTVGTINIHKKDSLEIIEDWDFHNQKHVSKHFLYMETGKSFPYTYTEERVCVLGGTIAVDALEKVSNYRKKVALEKRSQAVT